MISHSAFGELFSIVFTRQRSKVRSKRQRNVAIEVHFSLPSPPVIFDGSIVVGSRFLLTILSIDSAKRTIPTMIMPRQQNLWVDLYWFSVAFQGWHNLDVFAHAESRARDFFRHPLLRPMIFCI